MNSFGFPLVYYQCDNCGLIFQSAKESRAADPEFYAETYRQIYQSSEEPTEKDLCVQQKRADHLVSLVESRTSLKPVRALDIGASTGILLKSLQRAFGCEVVGVELGDAYRAYAERSGLKMYPSLEDLAADNPKKFDFVSLVHVLEHLPDPVSTLQHIRHELLSADGLLLLEVPNFYAHDSYELAHLTCFTPHTLRETARQAGYEVSFLENHGQPRSDVLNLYTTLLAEPLPAEVKPTRLLPERFVKMKRNLGMLNRRVLQKVFPHTAWLPLPDERES